MKRRFTKTTQSFQPQVRQQGKSPPKDSNEEVKKKNHAKNRRANPLRCSICSGKLRNAKLLPCFHTFCLECLTEYVERKNTSEVSFPCPLCLTDVEIPPEGVSNLTDNLYVLVYDAINTSKDLCQQCEAGTGVIAKCVDCNNNMCMACKDVHLKMKATKGHKVVLLSEQEKILNASLSRQAVCPEHADEDMCFLCRSCDHPVCKVCRKTSHNDHEVEEAANAAKRRKIETSRLVDGVRSYLPYVKNSIEKADKETDKLKSDVNQTKQQIINTAENMKKEIDAMCAKKIAELDTTLNDLLLSIDKFKTEMERVYLSIKILAEMSHQILELAPDGLLLRINPRIGKRLESIPTEIPSCSLDSARTRFEPKDLPNVDLLGDVHVSELPILKFSAADKKVPTFYCPGRPYSICPVSDNEAWVICDTPEMIQLYSKDGNIRKFLKMPGEVNDICHFPGGSLFVTELRGRAIWQIGRDDSVTTFTTIEDTVRGVCSYGGKFYITRKDSSRHMVSILSQDKGDIEREIIQDNGAAIFCHPDRIAVTSTGMICVTDRGKDGAVIFVKQNGHVLSSYTGGGHEESREEKSRFEPWGICVDKDDNVFVSDRFYDAIHVFNGEGVFQKYLLTEDDGIKRPLAVAVDTAGHIWVGNEDGSIHVFEYLELL